MQGNTLDWRAHERARAATLFRTAWGLAPAEGREALLQAASRRRVGHRWTTGRGACVLALLAGPALRPTEMPRAGAYRLFGCEVVDDLPVTWDGRGVTLEELLAAVGATNLLAPCRQSLWRRARLFAQSRLTARYGRTPGGASVGA